MVSGISRKSDLKLGIRTRFCSQETRPSCERSAYLMARICANSRFGISHSPIPTPGSFPTEGLNIGRLLAGARISSRTSDSIVFTLNSKATHSRKPWASRCFSIPKRSERSDSACSFSRHRYSGLNQWPQSGLSMAELYSAQSGREQLKREVKTRASVNWSSGRQVTNHVSLALKRMDGFAVKPDDLVAPKVNGRRFHFLGITR